MVNDVTISAVIPVYRVEDTLEACVESVLCQDVPSLEVILVDDGSPDGCGRLCDALAARDARVRVLHQDNGGPSVARNTGTAAARGRWVTYVDGDDLLHPAMFSRMLQAAAQTGADMVLCQLAHMEQFRLPADADAVDDAGEPAFAEDNTAAIRRVLYQDGYDVGGCAKLIRRRIAAACPFPPGTFFEDIIPPLAMLYMAAQVAFVPQTLYYYYQRPGSTMHSRTLRSGLDEECQTQRMLAFIAEKCPAALRAAKSKAFSNYCQIFRAVSAGTDTEETALRRRAAAFLRGSARDVLCDGRARTKNRLAAAMCCVSPELIGKWGK